MHLPARHPDSLTLDEFERLPEGEHRLELSRGVLVREPQPGAGHGVVVVNLLLRLAEWVHGRELGRVIVEAGFLLVVDPPTVRRPDAAYVSFQRWPAGSVPEGFWPFAPELAVEVVSPSNAAAEMQDKVLQYLESGTRIVWVVHPKTRTVEVWRPGADVRILREEDVLDGGDLLPGFEVDIERLFAV